MTLLKFLLAAGLALPLFAAAQPATLTPVGERITDAAIQQDHVAFERLQSRIERLNQGGRRLADYHLAKAQCWLDAGFHETTRNDRSAFAQEALTESDKLVAAMESAATPLPLDTPWVNDAAKLRPDLWERIDALKRAAGFGCAAQVTACAEVELVHAGNEFKQQGWRHARPYVQIAEDLLAQGTLQAAQCASPPPRVVP